MIQLVECCQTSLLKQVESLDFVPELMYSNDSVCVHAYKCMCVYIHLFSPISHLFDEKSIELTLQKIALEIFLALEIIISTLHK